MKLYCCDLLQLIGVLAHMLIYFSDTLGELTELIPYYSDVVCNFKLLKTFALLLACKERRLNILWSVFLIFY